MFLLGRRAHGGRPKRDFEVFLEKWLLDLKWSMRGDTTLWGNEYAALERWMLRQEKDFKDVMRGIDVEEKYDRCTNILKRFQTALTVLKAYHKDEKKIQDSDDFALTFDSAMDFLALPPACESPMPMWVHGDRHRRTINTVKDPADFWDNISSRALVDNGLLAVTDTPDKGQSMTAQFVSEWLLRKTQGKVTVPAEEVIDFITSAPLDNLESDIISALDMILCSLTGGKRRVTIYEPVQNTEITPAMMSSSTPPIVKAFLAYPAGKTALKEFKKTCDENNIKTAKIDVLSKSMEEIRLSILETNDSDKLSKAVASVDEKLQQIKDNDVELILDNMCDRINSLIHEIIAKCTGCFLSFLAELLPDPDKVMLVGTDQETMEMKTKRSNALTCAIALQGCTSMTADRWVGTVADGRLKLFAYMGNLLWSLPKLHLLEEGSALEEADAAKIHRSLGQQDFGFPEIDAKTQESLKQFHVSLRSPVRMLQLTAQVSKGAAPKLVEIKDALEKVVSLEQQKLQHFYDRDDIVADVSSFEPLLKAVEGEQAPIDFLLAAAQKLDDKQLVLQLRVLDVFFEAIPKVATAAKFFKQVLKAPGVTSDPEQFQEECSKRLEGSAGGQAEAGWSHSCSERFAEMGYLL